MDKEVDAEGPQLQAYPPKASSSCLRHKGQLCASFLSFLFHRAELCHRDFTAVWTKP